MSFIRVAWVMVAVHCSKTLTKIPMKSQPYTKNYRQPRKSGSGRDSLPQRKASSGYPIPHGQVENIYTNTVI